MLYRFLSIKHSEERFFLGILNAYHFYEFGYHSKLSFTDSGDILQMFDRLGERIKEREGKIAAYLKAFQQYPRIFFYGTGTEAKDIVEFMGDGLKGHEVCFIDSDKVKHGQEIVQGIYCRGIEAMYGYGEEAVIIITASGYADEIEYEFMKDEYQTADKLLHTTVCAEFCLLLARNNEIRATLARKGDILLWIDLVKTNLDRKRQLYDLKRLWRGMSFREFDASECLPPVRKRFSEYLRDFLAEHLPSEDGSFICCSAFSKDKIEHMEKAAENRFSKLYAFELNRLYIPCQMEGQVGEKVKIINACLGEDSFRLTKELCDSRVSIYGWLDFSSDDFLEVKSLDQLIDCGEVEGKITLVRLTLGNGTGSALMGMSKMLKRDKPILLLQLHGSCIMVSEVFCGIVRYLHDLIPEYHFSTMYHLPEKLDGRFILYVYA